MVALAPSRRTAPLLIVLVVLLFFFPAQVGSFQATHGPTSTLKECLMGLLLRALIALVARVMLSPGRHRLAGSVFSNLAPLVPSRDGLTVSLRC
jgi:hypothetical protein